MTECLRQGESPNPPERPLENEVSELEAGLEVQEAEALADHVEMLDLLADAIARGLYCAGGRDNLDSEDAPSIAMWGQQLLDGPEHLKRSRIPPRMLEFEIPGLAESVEWTHAEWPAGLESLIPAYTFRMSRIRRILDLVGKLSQPQLPVRLNRRAGFTIIGRILMRAALGAIERLRELCTSQNQTHWRILCIRRVSPLVGGSNPSAASF